MNEIEKKKIIDLKNLGMTYGEISKKLGVPRSTVSSFCKAYVGQPSRCDNCNASITSLKGRIKRFCSDKCRYQWWVRNRTMLSHKASFEYICQGCGRTFTTFRKDRNKYCCRQCYLKSVRKNND